MRGESGLTLVELLVAMAVTVVVASVLGFVVFQTFQVEEYGNDLVTATNELQNVLVWMHRDAVAARSAKGGAELMLTLPDSTAVVYLQDGSRLVRKAGNTVNVLARNIQGVGFSVSGRLIEVKIVSAPPGRSGAEAAAIYYLNMRPSP